MNEPAFSFHHAALKVKWAGEVIDSLQSAVDAWLNENPYAARTEYDAERDRSVVLVGLRGVSFVIPCLAADAIANLRNSLDCAWMGLNRAEGSKAKATLPIASNRKGLVSTVRRSAVKKRANDAIALLTEDLCFHQDFADNGSRPLCLLNKLSNWQKHNMLLIMPFVTSGTDVMIDTTHVDRFRATIPQTKGYGDFRIAAVSGQVLKIEQKGKTTGEIHVSADDVDNSQPLLPTVVQLLEVTRKGLEAFVNRFPEGDSPQFREALEGI